MPRPAKTPGAPQTPAQRKAEQRQRDRLKAWSDEPLTESTNEGLLSALGACLGGDYPERAGKLLNEVARRAGVTVTLRAGTGKGARA